MDTDRRPKPWWEWLFYAALLVGSIAAWWLLFGDAMVREAWPPPGVPRICAADAQADSSPASRAYRTAWST